ncbi:MAG TPA: KUP/HAK/KT family potassium transporter [Microbacteriaceae bacterium]|nr:KUP/HAK/KT family potassium transporter [Microbacteriaceae bacterium]
MSSTARKTGTVGLSFAALGVVFGDIGTSPIYALSESASAGGSSPQDIIGVASLVFWTLTIVVSFKYMMIVLRADNHGEGGTLALFALLPARIRHARSGSKYVPLFFIMLLAAAFLFADGMLTPAISVLSATEGLGAISPALGHLAVPLTVVILILLFGFQFRGTAFLGRVFGPVMLIWFGTLATFGLLSIVQSPEVLAGLNPVEAITFIGRHGWYTLIVMSSVILAVTGCESLYADLGHFGKRPLRLSWVSIVNTALVLSYFGQAGVAVRNPEHIEQLFFSQAADPVSLIFLVVISTLAAIIASQALISGVASLANQAMQLGLLSRMRVVHTSRDHSGQIYVPLINLIVAIGSITLVVVFESSKALAGAYAFCIAGVMLTTTVALFWVAHERWGWKRRVMVPVLSVFLVFDLAFVVSTSTKIPHGAWLPILIGYIVASIMWIWRKGRHQMEAKLEKMSMSWTEVEEHRRAFDVALLPLTGVYLSALPAVVPQALEEQINLMRAMPERIIVLNIESTNDPYSRKKANIEHVTEYITRVTLYSGFMDVRNVPRSLRTKELEKIFDEREAVYFVSNRAFTARVNSKLNKIERLIFTMMHRNSSPVTTFFSLPTRRVATFSVTLEI